jgi:hypothetical protein
MYIALLITLPIALHIALIYDFANEFVYYLHHCCSFFLHIEDIMQTLYCILHIIELLSILQQRRTIFTSDSKTSQHVSLTIVHCSAKLNSGMQNDIHQYTEKI